MMPETWLPTCTVVTAESVPVAVTVATTSPLSTFAFRNFGSADPRRENSRNAASAARATAIPMIRTRFFMSSSRTRETRMAESADGRGSQNATERPSWKALTTSVPEIVVISRALYSIVARRPFRGIQTTPG